MIIKTMALRVQLHRFEPNTSYERISHIQSAIQHILSERHPHLAAHYYVARGDFRGRFLSLEPKDGESWGVSGHLFQQDNPNLDIDEAIGELLDDIDGLDHGASDGDTSDEDGEEETPIAPNRFSPDARGRTTGIFGRSEPTTRQSPRRHQAVRPAHLMMDDDDDDDSDEEDPLEALARFGEDRQRQIRAAANQNMAENADASGLDSVLSRNMAELNLSPVVDDAEMRNITGQPETTDQRELARQVANAIAGTSSYTKSDTLDSNGKPRPLSELMRMARVTSLWPVLSQLQREQILDTPGVLANDRGYIARNVLVGAPIKRKRQFVQNAQGRLIYV